MKTAKLNPYEIQQMRYSMTIKQIADHYQVKANTLYQWCQRHDVAVTRITDYEVEEGLKISSVKELAYQYNVSIHLIYSRVKKLGITTGVIYDKEIIIDLRQRGYNYKEIAAAMGYSYGALMSWRHRTK